ncbi:MAG: phosphate signaling complex protein PhoU [Planctomycetes bacterium]|nr:phosphate signaling complex protein PhoU [Planctomycetota bacterium]
MTIHFHRDLEVAKSQILDMGGLIEAAVNKSISALFDRRPALAREVIAGDDEIDEREVRIEVECQKMLALHQPVASDLRFLLTVLKVNNDLERVGDLAVNIAERALFLGERPPLAVPEQLFRQAECTRAMLRDCLDALVNQDTALARRVRSRDDEVDELNRQMFQVMERQMRADPESIERALHLLSCSRHLERIADLATNIAEDVVFLVEGRVIRHRRQG